MIYEDDVDDDDDDDELLSFHSEVCVNNLWLYSLQNEVRYAAIVVGISHVPHGPLGHR